MFFWLSGLWFGFGSHGGRGGCFGCFCQVFEKNTSRAGVLRNPVPYQHHELPGSPAESHPAPHGCRRRAGHPGPSLPSADRVHSHNPLTGLNGSKHHPAGSSAHPRWLAKAPRRAGRASTMAQATSQRTPPARPAPPSPSSTPRALVHRPCPPPPFRRVSLLVVPALYRLPCRPTAQYPPHCFREVNWNHGHIRPGGPALPKYDMDKEPRKCNEGGGLGVKIRVPRQAARKAAPTPTRAGTAVSRNRRVPESCSTAHPLRLPAPHRAVGGRHQVAEQKHGGRSAYIFS